jgi:hypothetical protein
MDVEIFDDLPEGVEAGDLMWTSTISTGDQVEFTMPAMVTTDPDFLHNTPKMYFGSAS